MRRIVNTTHQSRSLPKFIVLNGVRAILFLFIGAFLITTANAQSADARWKKRFEPEGGISTRTKGLVPAQQVSSSTAAQIAKPSSEITGSWLQEITPTGAPFSLKSLLTFDHDGNVIATVQGDVTTEPPIVVSPSHGAWTKTGSRTFAMTIVAIGYDLQGNLVGIQKVKQTLNLSADGSEYSGQSAIEVLDPFGNVIFSGDAAVQAQRINVEPLVP